VTCFLKYNYITESPYMIVNQLISAWIGRIPLYT